MRHCLPRTSSILVLPTALEKSVHQEVAKAGSSGMCPAIVDSNSNFQVAARKLDVDGQLDFDDLSASVGSLKSRRWHV